SSTQEVSLHALSIYRVARLFHSAVDHICLPANGVFRSGIHQAQVFPVRGLWILQSQSHCLRSRHQPCDMSLLCLSFAGGVTADAMARGVELQENRALNSISSGAGSRNYPGGRINGSGFYTSVVLFENKIRVTS